jgi:SDR family mycofactocin-dependent oxidoreductase
MGKLEGKVAFITGAARGQGRSHAIRLAEEGADIIAVDVSKQIETVLYPTAKPGDLEETVRQVEALGRRIIASEADVRDLSALRKAAAHGFEQLGCIDIVLANAGIAVNTSVPTLEMAEDEWQTMIDINLTGGWKTIQAVTPHVIAGGRGGSIVVTSSIAALTPNEHMAGYAAAKAGLIGMMKVLAKELGPQNIRVNTVHTTCVATDMLLNDYTFGAFRPDLERPTQADFEEVARTAHRLPVPMIEAIDVSNAVLHLVSDEGRYVTGNTHVIDAGWML